MISLWRADDGRYGGKLRTYPSKRHRLSNFTLEELGALVELIHEKSDVNFNKFSSTVDLSEKNKPGLK